VPDPQVGSLWRTPAVWAKRRTRDGCPICRAGRPRDVVATLAVTWVAAPRRAPLPGYVAVIATRHVIEPFDLPAQTARAFWNDVMLAAKALSNLLSPIKMNYELHGNTVPHLHVHLFPRYAHDPFVGGPIDSRRAGFLRSQDECLRLGRTIQEMARHPPRRRPPKPRYQI
jgi:diadenosine tetraphosphate (Ap4A) HIT family hydrolase